MSVRDPKSVSVSLCVNKERKHVVVKEMIKLMAISVQIIDNDNNAGKRECGE